jgi:protein-disulfide isomerase
MKVIKTLLLAVILLIAATVHAQEVGPGADSPLRTGNPDAPFKIEVFYDYQCGACASFHEKLTKIITTYPNNVVVTIRHYPMPFHNHAILAARAVEAARSNGKGIEMTEKILANQENWTADIGAEQKFFRYVTELSLDLQQFKQDFESQEVLDRINLDVERAKSLKVNAVPTVILNGKQLNYSELAGLEDIILKGN